MSDYKIQNKTQSIAIFYERVAKTQGVTTTIKHYIHPQNTKIFAYVRNLSQNEISTNTAVYDTNTIQITMNYRKLNNDMFVEFKGNTYQLIGSPDEFDFQDTEIKLFCRKIVTKTNYSSIEYENWATTEAENE